MDIIKRKINNCHFTLETRKIIENMLNEDISCSNIALSLHRNRSSIIREINRHKELNFPSIFNNYHPCINSSTCPVKEIDCFKTCKSLKFNICEKLVKSPLVCNGCSSKKGCRYVKVYYKSEIANSEYETHWKQDRKHTHYTEEQINFINTEFKQLLLQTNSVYHTIIHFEELGVTFIKQSSVYRQMKKNPEININLCDLPRYRKQSSKEIRDKNYKRDTINGHTYEDYKIYKNNNPKSLEMQMDTVEGIKGINDSIILTLCLTEIDFLFMFKIDSQTNEEVIRKLSWLKSILTEELFNKLMEILLTDNGKEFIQLKLFNSNFPKINLFYCHPYSSFEKGTIENSHELLRRIIPKGVSLKPYSQKDYNLICSHVNSLKRKSLDGKSPFELITNFIPKNTLEQLDIRLITSKDVNLNPNLLGDKNISNIKKYLDKTEIQKRHIRL